MFIISPRRNLILELRLNVPRNILPDPKHYLYQKTMTGLSKLLTNLVPASECCLFHHLL